MAPLLEPNAPLDLGLQVFTLTALPPLAGSLPSEQSYQSELLTAGPDRSSIEYKALTWLYCLIARLQLPFTGRLSTKIIAGFKVWCYGPDLLWLCPQANLVLSQAWIDALSNESSWPQFVAVRSDVLMQHQDVAFLLAELLKAITVVPFTAEEAV